MSSATRVSTTRAIRRATVTSLQAAFDRAFQSRLVSVEFVNARAVRVVSESDRHAFAVAFVNGFLAARAA